MKSILISLRLLASFSWNPPLESTAAKLVQWLSPSFPKLAKKQASKTIHVIVVRCDNQSQGIVPMPAQIFALCFFFHPRIVRAVVRPQQFDSALVDTPPLIDLVRLTSNKLFFQT